MLEIVLIAWRSAAALYSCYRCVSLSLEFNSHDVIDAMIAETAAEGIRVLDAGWFDFFALPTFKATTKSKNYLLFSDPARE